MTPTNNLDEDLISYWSFDSNANDIHRNNDGTVTGATSGQTGIINDCYYFDGVDDNIDIPKDDFELPNGNHLTVNLWLKTDILTGIVLGAWDVALPSIIQKGFGLYTDGKWYMGTGTLWRSINSGILADSKWHMYTLIYDGSMKSYLDGVFLETSVSFYANYVTDSRIRLAADNREGRAAQRKRGYIDELGIWKRSLNVDDDVTRLYNDGNGLNYNKYRYGI
jgi:Concanavalin A-like lectin/glucanases superfamily